MLTDRHPSQNTVAGEINLSFLGHIRFFKGPAGRLCVDLNGELYTLTPEQETQMVKSLNELEKQERFCIICGR